MIIAQTLLRSFLACFLALTFTAPAQATVAEILMLTWRGETEAERGFRDRLREHGIEARITVFDAARERRALAEYLRAEEATLPNYDLVYTFGTTASKVLKSASRGQATQLFNIVSDPVAAGLVTSLDAPGGRTTGTTHTVSLEMTFQVLDQLVEYQSIVVVYDPREDNTIAVKDTVLRVGAERGKSVKAVRFVPDAADLNPQLTNFRAQLDGVDLVYIPSGSSFAERGEDLLNVVPDTVLTVGAIGRYVELGAVLSVGPDYYERGAATAESAVQILNGMSAGSVPVNEVSSDGIVLYVHKDRAEALGLDPSQSGFRVVYE